VSRRGQLALIGEPRQKSLDLGCAQVLRVSQPEPHATLPKSKTRDLDLEDV
jgi:hypothetical protein